MILLAYLLGLGLPGVAGWLLVGALEGGSPVLLRLERAALGVLLGIALPALGGFLTNAFLGFPLTPAAYLWLPAAVALGAAGAAFRHRRSPRVRAAHSPRPSGVPGILVCVLAAAAAVKILACAVTFLALTPTFLDDTLDNWNIRGRTYYEQRAVTLSLPMEDPAESRTSIGSYPPTVPLVKSWLAQLSGGWSDAAANPVHAVWLVLAVVLLYCSLRHVTSVSWALLGAYALMSLPLYALHGTNTYADAILSAYAFAAVSLLFHAGRQEDAGKAMAFLRLAGVAMALPPVFKNEGLLLHLPPLLLAGAWTAWRLRARGVLKPRHLAGAVVALLAPAVLIAGPWIAFKLLEGLTFGNAKSVAGLGIGFEPAVINAVFINTFFEANWLLFFPLFFGLLAVRWRLAFGRYLVPVAFFLTLYVGQICIVLFTSLATEAKMQTGYARGLAQIVPVAVFIATLLLWEGRKTMTEAWEALWTSASVHSGSVDSD